MSESESKLTAEAVVYFVISPLEGPACRICGDDDLQAVGGVHALERRLENESYWFARMGQISFKLNSDGVTFQDSELAKLPEPPDGAWQTAVRFWYDSLWLSKPVLIDELVQAEYSFRIPLQLRWAADHRLISVQISRTAYC
jgi:hypothetical protein